MKRPSNPHNTKRNAAAEAAGLLGALPAGAPVLVIRLRSMGDTVLLTPALRLLHEWRPDLKISVLLDPPWGELLQGNPAVSSVLATGRKLETLWRVRQGRFAAVINLHGGPTSALVTRSSGAALRAGFAHFRGTSAYNILVPSAQEVLSREGPVHTAEHIASCFFYLGVPHRAVPPPAVFPDESARLQARKRLAEMGVEPGTEISVLHPAALYPTKQWPAERFAALGRWIEEKKGLRPVYLCGPGETGVLDAVDRAAQELGGPPIVRAVAWPLAEMIALIARARLFVGNDSGPAHVANACGVRTVVLFGSSHSALWKPWSAASAAVVQNPFDCNPCPGKRCHAFDEPRCILSIAPEQVMTAVNGLL